jgi:peptidoglycan glycosyltransferase
LSPKRLVNASSTKRRRTRPANRRISLNAHLRRAFYLFAAGFVVLVGVLAYWQVYMRESLVTNPANSLQSRRVQEVPRGTILAGDGETELASSVWNGDTYERVYPEGPLYANVVGYWSQRYGANGIEIGQNNNLSGAGEPETLDELINQLQGGPQAGNNIQLTLDPALQRSAYEQLASSSTGRGGAVALDPKNGEILALVSYPSFDPNKVDEDFAEFIEDPNSPLINRATQGYYPPGSTFKVVTAAAALEAGLEPSEKFNDTGTYETPGYEVYNYRARKYGEVTFDQALTYSINTVFARIGYEYVGAERLAQTAWGFGFGDSYEDFPLSVRPSSLGELPPDQWAQGLVAQIAFGQGPVTSTPFEMALTAATIANDGTRMEPRLVREVRSPDGIILDKPTSRVLGRAVPKETARTLNDMMQNAVSQYETGAMIPGIKVAGKTGTAEAPGGELHSWFISFAPADDPKIAVAIIVENGQEGYKSALPIARRLTESYLKSQTTLPDERTTTPPPAPPTPPNETTTAGSAQSKSGEPKNEDGASKLPFPNPFQPPAKENPTKDASAKVLGSGKG